MIEPKIVFCSNNHIYDSAINAECPYCLNIAREQQKLSEMMLEPENNNIQANVEADETTEYIDHTEKAIQQEYDGYEATELFNRTYKPQEIEEDDDATELFERTYKPQEDEEDDDATELIDYSARHREAYLVGWLVGIDGEQKGRSVEIVEGTNYIYMTQGRITLKSHYLTTERKLGTIYQDNNKEYYFQPEVDAVCRINDVIISGLRVIKPYDFISIQGSSFLFVNLNSDYFEWGK